MDINEKLKKVVDRILKSASPDKIILFGSRADGMAREESDYDLLILKSGIKHKRDLAKKLYRLLLGTGIAVDIIVESTEKFEELKENPFLIYSEAYNRGVVLYDRLQKTGT